MKIPHRDGRRERLQVSKQAIAPGKSSGFDLDHGAREGAAEIVLGVRVPSRKTGTARAQNGRDSGSGHSLPQQFLGDPFIGNAPIRLGEAFGNAQPAQPIGIDAGGCRMGQRVGVGDGPARAGANDGKSEAVAWSHAAPCAANPA